MLEPPGYFQQQAGLIPFEGSGHPRELVLIVPQRPGLFGLGGGFRILKDELTVFGIAIGFVAFEAGSQANLGPNLVGKEAIGGRDARRPGIRLALLATSAGGENRQNGQGQDTGAKVV